MDGKRLTLHQRAQLGDQIQGLGEVHCVPSLDWSYTIPNNADRRKPPPRSWITLTVRGRCHQDCCQISTVATVGAVASVGSFRSARTRRNGRDSKPTCACGGLVYYN